MTNATKEGRVALYWPSENDAGDVYIHTSQQAPIDGLNVVGGTYADALAICNALNTHEALVEALEKAEAALADIGDSEGPPMSAGWCEGRAYRVLATVRTALSLARSKA